MTQLRGLVGAALAALAVVTPLPAGAQSPAPAPPPGQPGDSYFQFVLGRHLETLGEIDKAIAAHREAARIDPASAEIRAEIASVLARQGQTDEAVAEARAALAIDPANVEANRVVGGILAAAAEDATGPSQGVDEAIAHLERGRRSEGVDRDPSLELTLARLYVRAAQHDKAIALLEALVESDPIAEAYLLMAQSHGSRGRAERAAQALEEGAMFNPRLYVSLGELFERQQQWDRAAKAYERAAEADGASAEVSMRWAGALLNQPGREAARRALEVMTPVAAERSTDERAVYLLAQAQRKTGDLASAEASARRLLGLDPASFWGAYALTQVLEDRGDYGAVAEALAPILESRATNGAGPDRQSLTLLTHLGFAYLQVGRPADAARAFERGKARGGDATFDLYLAQAYLAGREFGRALETLTPLRARQPDDPRLAQYEARALAGLRRVDEAVTLLRAAIGQRPGERGTYLALADVLSNAGRHADAQRALEDAAARFPGDIGIVFQQGAAFERGGDVENAEARFRTVISRDPKHAPALNYLGYMLAERGLRLDEAVALISRALALDPENGSFLDSLGWAYYKQRRFADAERELARAAAKLPAASVVQDHHGDALAALDRRRDAIAAWERALGGDRDGIDVAAIQQKIAGLRAKALP